MSRQDTKWYIYVTIQSQVSTMYVLVSIIFATTQLPKKKSFTTCSKAKQDGLFKRLKKLSAFLSPLKGLLCEPPQYIFSICKSFYSCIVYNFLVETRKFIDCTEPKTLQNLSRMLVMVNVLKSCLLLFQIELLFVSMCLLCRSFEL